MIPIGGDGGDGSGRNMFGKLLMQVRGDLRAKYGDSALVTAPRISMFDSSRSAYHRFLSAKDDSAVPSAAPTTHLSPRKRSASYSNLASLGLSEGHSLSRPPLSELGYSEHRKTNHTLGSGFTTSPKKTKSTSASSKYSPLSPHYLPIPPQFSETSTISTLLFQPVPTPFWFCQGFHVSTFFFYSIKILPQFS